MSKVQYIGPNKVLGIKEQDFTTPLGSEVVEVEYMDAPPELMTKHEYEELISPKASDYTSLRDKRISLLVPRLKAVIMEYSIKLFEHGELMKRVLDSLANPFDRATNYLWTKSDKDWAPGANSLDVLSLLDAEKVLRTIKPEDDKNSKEKTK